MTGDQEPANPDVQATSARFLGALQRTERLPPEKLETYQRRLLDALIRHAATETAFYAERLRPLFQDDGSIDWRRWSEVPVLTRPEAQRCTEALRARRLPAAAGTPADHHSSGSTGEIFRYRDTALQRFATQCANERFFNWHGLDPAALTAFIWAMDHPEDAAYPEGRPEKPWRPGHPESRGIDLAITTPVAEQVDWLRRKRPAYLATYPTNLREIGRLATEQRAPLHFQAVLTNGEMTSRETGEEIQHHFAKEPLDRYGATEAGLIAMTCPRSFLHHVAAEMVFLEIVDDADRPVSPGQEGRIIVTPLYGLAMPLIRYDMGDWGAFAREPCPCGRTLPLLARIYGRSRNMFRFADGTRVWPVLQSWKVQTYLPHRQFQVIQTAPDAIEYRYVPLNPAQAIDVAGLNAYARQVLHPSVTVTPVAVSEIPRPQSGKHEDYISLVA